MAFQPANFILGLPGTVYGAVVSTGTAAAITSDGGGATADVSVGTGDTAVTTVTADGTGTETFSIVGGAEQAMFTLNASSGALAFKATSIDGEYAVTVKATNDWGSDTQAITVTVEAAPSYEGPLDLVPGAIAAFDQFAPSAAYLAGANNYALLRRSTGGTMQFQYAADGSIDQAAIIAWRDALGAADAFVVTANDGSGNTIDLSQATAANQPEWITSGDIAKFSKSNVSDHSVASADTAVTWQVGDPATLFAVVVFDPGSTSLTLSVESATNNNFFEFAGDGTAPYSDIQTDPGGAYSEWQAEAYPVAGVPHVIELVYDTSGNATMLIDGVVQTLEEVGGSGVIPLPGFVAKLRMACSANPAGTQAWYLWRQNMSAPNRALIRNNLAANHKITFNVTAPAITPDPADAGQLLTVSNGTWAVGANPVYTYQWYLEGVLIDGATNQTYQTITPDQDFLPIWCIVTNTNDAGVGAAQSQTVTLAQP